MREREKRLFSFCSRRDPKNIGYMRDNEVICSLSIWKKSAESSRGGTCGAKRRRSLCRKEATYIYWPIMTGRSMSAAGGLCLVQSEHVHWELLRKRGTSHYTSVNQTQVTSTLPSAKLASFEKALGLTSKSFGLHPVPGKS